MTNNNNQEIRRLESKINELKNELNAKCQYDSLWRMALEDKITSLSDTIDSLLCLINMIADSINASNKQIDLAIKGVSILMQKEEK